MQSGCDHDELLIDEIKEDILNTPDDCEYGYFIECDLEYPAEIKEKTENFPLCPYQTKADPDLFSGCMNSVKQPNYKPTEKLMCDLTNKEKYLMHYRMFVLHQNGDESNKDTLTLEIQTITLARKIY